MFADGHCDYTASGANALPRTGVSEDFFGYTALESNGDSASSTPEVSGDGLRVQIRRE
jgi:hypothetical protein